MQRQILFSAAIALFNVASVSAQAAAATVNPLHAFIGAAGAAASAVKSAAAKETPTSSSSSSSATPTPTSAAAPIPPSSTATAGKSGLSKGATIGIIVGAIVAALLILTLIGLCCWFCLRRRRSRRSKRNQTVTPIKDSEVESWKRPINPGRHYSNYSPAQRGQIPMEQQSPTVPLMAAVAAEHHNYDRAPSLSQHPAMRQPENPFVPVPPSPRRTAPNSRAGLTDGMVAGDPPYLMDEKASLRDRSRSSSRPRTGGNGLPTSNINNPNRPPTPMGLDAFGTPAGATILNPKDHADHPPYSGIGQPYDDMHVHVLQTDAPSRELRHSLNQRGEGAPIGANPYADQPRHRNSRGYSTPPEVPSRSPNREKRASMFADSSYDSSLSATTDSNSSGERYERGPDPYQPAHRETVAPWEAHQHRFSDSTSSGATQVAPPPIPWEESEYNQNAARRQSHSPRQSAQYDGRRRSSRSPATSINGQPRRLRFEDLHSNGGQGNRNGGYESVPLHGGHDSFDGYDQSRWSQGVGEAL